MGSCDVDISSFTLCYVLWTIKSELYIISMRIDRPIPDCTCGVQNSRLSEHCDSAVSCRAPNQ